MTGGSDGVALRERERDESAPASTVASPPPMLYCESGVEVRDTSRGGNTGIDSEGASGPDGACNSQSAAAKLAVVDIDREHSWAEVDVVNAS